MSLFPIIPPNVADIVFTPSVSGDYIGETAATTFAAGSVTWGASDDNLRSNAKTFPGNFTLEADVNDVASAWSFGVFPTSEDGTFLGTDSAGRGDMDLMTDSWYFYQDGASQRFLHAGTDRDLFTVVSGDTIRISRIGSTFRAFINGTLDFTWTETSSVEVRPCMGNVNQRGDLTNMTWTFTP